MSNANLNMFTLNNKIKIPTIGIGTGIISLDGPKSIISDIIKRKSQQTIKAYRLTKVLSRAPREGCSMFDTSKAYGMSENILGNAIKKYNRDEIFVITKLTNTDQRLGDVRSALEDSLKTMRLEYIDLYLIHWPQTETFMNSWIQMEKLYREGYVKAIGVSNFHQHHLEKLLSIATIVPAVNEIERHPLLNQKNLINYCERIGTKIIAYTPIGRMHPKISNNPVLLELSKKYSKTVPQIILRWNFQQDIISIPHTLKVERMKEYMNIFNFNISADDILAIDNINENFRLRHDPDNCDFSKL